MDIIFAYEFKKEFKKIKEKQIRLNIIKQIKKISEKPTVGKPLQYGLKAYRSLRVTPYRILYRKEKDTIIINCFDHRKKVYQKK
jgi:mRNA-degrading endonuclease RelE of RelBE toxin-antitoxin system